LDLPTDEQATALKRLNMELAAAKADVATATSEESKKSLQDQVNSIQKSIKSLDSQIRRCMISAALAEPRVTRVLPRGNWLDDTGPIVQPAIPEFMGVLTHGEQRANRLDLANWLTDTEDGISKLTARVMANRFWYLLIGHAIAADLDDFGGQGTPPVAPKLLDNLAIEFEQSGWDVKHMFRLIANSRTYQQSSVVTPQQLAADPGNRWFARAARHRLPAEMIRDSVLQISGLLVKEIGGPSAKPYQPAGYYRHLNFPTRKYQHDTNGQQYRRGVYVHWQRQFLHPMMRNLDAPTREECTAQRARSNTPLAALTLLNDPTFVEAARVFADRILSEAHSDFNSRIDFAFMWTISRKPNAHERHLIKSLYQHALTDFKSAPDDAESLTQVGLAPNSEHDTAELAAWTTVARALFNLNESITRN
jgi:hypothetical protein